MLFAEYAIADNGYVDKDGNALASIDGLSGMGHQRFSHAGYSGGPAPSAVIAEAPDKSKVLAAFSDTVEPGGNDVAAVDVLTLLVADYGWPDTAVMGADGLPMVPGD